METKRGRPPKEEDEKATFRNVAVPIEVYEMIRELAGMEDRTIARQLAVIIKQTYFARNVQTLGDLEKQLERVNDR